jgi:hypothetical protein
MLIARKVSPTVMLRARTVRPTVMLIARKVSPTVMLRARTVRPTVMLRATVVPIVRKKMRLMMLNSLRSPSVCPKLQHQLLR